MYDEKLNYGDEANPIWRDRLWINNNSNGYGFNLFDRKEKRHLLYGQTKEFCQQAKELLIAGDLAGFEHHKKNATEIVTNQILIYHEKYGNSYYNVFTLSQLYRVALEIVTRRLNDGYITKWNNPPVKPDFDKEDIEKLPESLRKSASATFEDYILSLRAHQENNEIYESAKKAIENNDGSKAWEIICHRAGYEYEKFEIVTPENL